MYNESSRIWEIQYLRLRDMCLLLVFIALPCCRMCICARMYGAMYIHNVFAWLVWRANVRLYAIHVLHAPEQMYDEQ